MLDAILQHLEALVGFDTRNPPRAIGTDGIYAYLRAALPGFELTTTDHGAGAVSLLAVRGAPKRLYNFHLDTVPAAEGWSRDPLRLHRDGERVVGLGACDIKGAAAAMLVAAGATRGDLALLFSSDEEANDPRCIAAFLAQAHGFEQAIVAEPTRAEAVLAHRGIVSARATFRGVPGHASELRGIGDSAVHRAILWGERALAYVRAMQEQAFGELRGFPFNIGRIEGGIKTNIIAGAAELRFGFRPLPSQSVDELVTLFRGLVPPDWLGEIDVPFQGPSLPAGRGEEAGHQVAAARALAGELGLPIGRAVNFWTEASLFSQAGLTALVFGPGDIAQAHSADEWVAIEQLERVAQHYVRMIDATDGR
jgi:acetylornithine deacetylase